ncbi:hypothetical protein OS493_028958 [Desmophyllum pertusum]|uniref:Uncharacterized protein n=1 Tax=Desmophyllum pertusum TaxID=174260 RepID=A0A9X0CQU6_9CNID|nr:hypothetical protein OS493_028958 [Desmophyllum pertusum]
MKYTLPRCELYKGDNVVNITFKMTANQWKDDTFRESISRAFTEYCSSQRPCNLRNSLEDATSRRSNPIDTIVFRPDDVMVLRRYPEEQPGMFSVVSAVLVPSNEPRMAQRETIPTVVLCRMVVKTSKRISKYMGNIDIIFINGEKDPSCVSERKKKDNVNTNGGKNWSTERELIF